MGNLKELSQAIQTNLLGIGYALHRGHYTEALGRTAMIPFNLASQSKERNNALSAVHQFEVKFSAYEGKRDLLMIDRNGFLPSPATSLRESDINYLASLQREGKNTDAARFQWRHNLRLIERIYSLNEGQTLMVFLPHGGKIEDGVALAQYTRSKDGASAQSRLLPKLNEEEGQQILEGLISLGGEQANLREGQDSVLWSGVKLEDNLFNFTQRQEEVNSFLTGILGADFLQREVPTCLDGGSCSSSTGEAVASELKPVVAVGLAGADGGMGGGGGGGGNHETLIKNDFLEKEVPLLAVPSFLLAASLPTPALSITQSVAPEVLFATALHNTVANDNDIPASHVLLKPAPSFFAMEQNLGRTTHLESARVAEPRFTLDRAIQPAHIIPVVSKTEPVSMFQNIYTKPLSAEQEAVSVLQPQVLMISEITKESLAAVERKMAVIVPAPEMTTATVLIKGTEIVDQPVILSVAAEKPVLIEKPVEELSLPLLEIAADTAPVMVMRAKLNLAVKADEIGGFEIETADNQLPIPTEKKVIVGVDQKQSKLFLVENFSVVSWQAAKTEKKPDWQIKKLVWMIKAPESKSGRASILELKLPCSPYAFLHFLQKVVKKVIGQDAIRTRQIAVMAEKEDIDLNLELVNEIEYYLQLLRGRSYAQAFAFVD